MAINGAVRWRQEVSDLVGEGICKDPDVLQWDSLDALDKFGKECRVDFLSLLHLQPNSQGGLGGGAKAELPTPMLVLQLSTLLSAYGRYPLAAVRALIAAENFSDRRQRAGAYLEGLSWLIETVRPKLRECSGVYGPDGRLESIVIAREQETPATYAHRWLQEAGAAIRDVWGYSTASETLATGKFQILDDRYMWTAFWQSADEFHNNATLGSSPSLDVFWKLSGDARLPGRCRTVDLSHLSLPRVSSDFGVGEMFHGLARGIVAGHEDNADARRDPGRFPDTPLEEVRDALPEDCQNAMPHVIFAKELQQMLQVGQDFDPLQFLDDARYPSPRSRLAGVRLAARITDFISQSKDQ